MLENSWLLSMKELGPTAIVLDIMFGFYITSSASGTSMSARSLSLSFSGVFGMCYFLPFKTSLLG